MNTLPELTPAELAAIREDEAAIIRDVETSIARIKSEIFDAERFLHDTLSRAGGTAADGLSRQTRDRIAVLKADLIETEAILEAIAEGAR